MSFRYDVCVMISLLFKLNLKIIFIMELVKFDCEF